MAAVTDSEVTAVRAWLKGELRKAAVAIINATLPRPLSRTFSLLNAATFAIAVRRRFSPAYTRADVGRWVAAVRANPRYLASDLNPRVAEYITLQALGGKPAGTHSRFRQLQARLDLLRVLVQDLQLDDAGIDALLAEARALADAWSSNR